MDDSGEGFKGMQLLGFTAAAKLPPYLNIGSADYVLPTPPKTHSSGLWGSGGTDVNTAARCVRERGVAA